MDDPHSAVGQPGGLTENGVSISVFDQLTLVDLNTVIKEEDEYIQQASVLGALKSIPCNGVTWQELTPHFHDFQFRMTTSWSGVAETQSCATRANVPDGGWKSVVLQTIEQEADNFVHTGGLLCCDLEWTTTQLASFDEASQICKVEADGPSSGPHEVTYTKPYTTEVLKNADKNNDGVVTMAEVQLYADENGMPGWVIPVICVLIGLMILTCCGVAAMVQKEKQGKPMFAPVPVPEENGSVRT
jgi:hypothetical protein